jgi:hypothetical protein
LFYIFGKGRGAIAERFRSDSLAPIPTNLAEDGEQK